MQQAPYGQPPGWAQSPQAPVIVSQGLGVTGLLGVIVILLAALLSLGVFEIRQTRMSDQTRAQVQAVYATSDTFLKDAEANFNKSVFNTTSTDSAPKQQVAELEYMFEMQVLIAQQNKAMLQALLNS